MQGIDTNVLVRYLVKDDPKQFQQALDLMKSIDIIYLNPIVLVETVWVLTHCYHIARERQCEELTKLLAMRRINTSNKALTQKAITDYRKGYDFADAMINQHNTLTTSKTWTFDRKASRLEYFA